MDPIINQLKKLRPPNFVTVKAENQSSRSAIMLKWAKLSKDLTKYENHTGLLSSEIEILNGFLIRKEVQLRLEKALQLTLRIFKLTSRWKSNDLLSQLKHFQNAMGKFTKSSGLILLEHSKAPRLPSSQWCSWIIYLSLREIAILAKIKLECEYATKYWLGLISASHHWGDSLVVTGILSRLWHLSSLIVEQFITSTYPSILFILELLEPTQSSNWPTDDWQAPKDLKHWLEECMKLPFEPSNMAMRPTVKQKSTGQMSSVLNKIFDTGNTSKESAVENDPSSKFEILFSTTLQLEGKDEDEDFGTPVEIQVKAKKQTKKVKEKKKATGNKLVKGDVKTKCVKNAEKKEKSAITNISESTHIDWKSFRIHWRKFFKKYDNKLNSKVGRKTLLVRIKKYKLRESDKKLKSKLIRLGKCLREPTDENTATRVLFQQFETFIHKRTKQIKKSASSQA